MKTNRDSEYYIGKYYSPYGGVAEHFSKAVPLKEAIIRHQSVWGDHSKRAVTEEMRIFGI